MTFQSTPRKGSDRTASRPLPRSSYFNPRSPWGERRQNSWGLPISAAYFNPRSPWGERPDWPLPAQGRLPISIHAPRGGSDHRLRFGGHTAYDFNPRSPWGERQPGAFKIIDSADFNPRSPWGERLRGAPAFSFQVCISIHAPRGGSDDIKACRQELAEEFQSTLPVGGATFWKVLTLTQPKFQSTLPVGGATSGIAGTSRDVITFQSTLPVGGATSQIG